SSSSKHLNFVSYLKKLKTIESFNEFWPSIVHNDCPQEESDEASVTREEESIEEEKARRPIALFRKTWKGKTINIILSLFPVKIYEDLNLHNI
ncbi:hypothetical protein BpHYR1_014800, partial [Brachionus plicatilis]